MSQAQQPETLRLADRLEDLGLALPAYGFDDLPVKEAAAELRRLHSSVQKLEAQQHKPLSIERLEALWGTQRRFHGGEPLKMGHVEFVRLVEVEYGVLGRIPMAEENGGQVEELERNHSDEDAAIAAGKVQAAVQGRI